MEIAVKMAGISGTFDLSEGELICVHYKKYCETLLCFKDQGNLPFASIKLHDSGLYKDAEATYPDACALGDEIVRRWNRGDWTPNAGEAIPQSPTLQQLYSVCLSYRHDFGLLEKAQQKQISEEARQWWRAIAKEINEQ